MRMKTRQKCSNNSKFRWNEMKWKKMLIFKKKKILSEKRKSETFSEILLMFAFSERLPTMECELLARVGIIEFTICQREEESAKVSNKSCRLETTTFGEVTTLVISLVGATPARAVHSVRWPARRVHISHVAVRAIHTTTTVWHVVKHGWRLHWPLLKRVVERLIFL